jgi:hypothetical protein
VDVMDMKFNKMIKDIVDNSDFFEIDYQDLINNFDTNDTDEKDRCNLQLSLTNVAFVDAVRGDISRPKFIDRLLTIFRKEMISDIKNRMPEENESG